MLHFLQSDFIYAHDKEESSLHIFLLHYELKKKVEHKKNNKTTQRTVHSCTKLSFAIEN